MVTNYRKRTRIKTLFCKQLKNISSTFSIAIQLSVLESKELQKIIMLHENLGELSHIRCSRQLRFAKYGKIH
jgi:hypothetical protein